MDSTNIILWTSSLILAVTGIVFGIIASINSTKANRNIENLLRDQLVSEEASKYFYSFLESINHTNKTMLTKLQSTNGVKWSSYSTLAIKTRMAPIPRRIEKHLLTTEYRDLMIHYADTKLRIDSRFLSIIESYEVLASVEKISPQKNKALIDYHKSLGSEISTILKEYYALTKT